MQKSITVSNEVLDLYKKVNFRKVDFIILKLNDDKTQVILDYASTKDDSYDTFVEKLPEDEPRYTLYNYKFKTNENIPRNVDKLLFFFWCPLATPIAKKLPYTAQKAVVISNFKGVFKDFEVNTINKLDEEELIKYLQKYT